MSLLSVFLSKDGLHHGADHRLVGLVDASQEIALEMHAAALPPDAQNFACRRLQTLMRVADDHLYTAQATPRQRAQELGPEGLGLGWHDSDAKDLTAPVRVYRDGYYNRHGHNPPALAQLYVGGVEPQERPVAFERAVQECLHPLVYFLAEARHLAFRGARQPHSLHQIIDGARGNPLNIRFLYHRHKRLLGRLARLKKRRKITAFSEFGNIQADGACAGIPSTRPVAIALVLSLRAALTAPGAANGGHLNIHQSLGSILDQVAQKISVIALGDCLRKVDYRIGHRVLLSGHWSLNNLRLRKKHGGRQTGRALR